MIEIIFFVAAVTLFVRSLGYVNQKLTSSSGPDAKPAKQQSQRLEQSLSYADRLFSEKRYLAAEKAYLQVLKIDHRNVTAYNRMGMIYASLKQFDNAIECFQIASQLSPSAVSFHNLGLVYFENNNYTKAAAAFEKSVAFEPTAARYLGAAKSYQKLNNRSKVITSLEKAADLDPKHLPMLAKAYGDTGDQKAKQAVIEKIASSRSNPRVHRGSAPKAI